MSNAIFINSQEKKNKLYLPVMAFYIAHINLGIKIHDLKHVKCRTTSDEKSSSRIQIYLILFKQIALNLFKLFNYLTYLMKSVFINNKYFRYFKREYFVWGYFEA